MWGIPATEITIWAILGFWTACFAATITILALPDLPHPRWAQGWLIPHREKQEKCRIQCATCGNEEK